MKTSKSQSKFENNFLTKKTERSSSINANELNNSLPIENDIPTKTASFRIIEPYRSLGLITNDITPSYFKRGIDRFLLSSNGRSFLLYNIDKIRLERISPPMSADISALSVYKNKILTGINGNVQLWDKLHIIKELGSNKDITITVKQILTFDDILIYTNSNGNLLIYQITSCELISNLNLNIAYLIHPTTYFNRILYSVKLEKYEIDLEYKNYSANLILYNINTEKEIYNFKQELPSLPIKLFSQSPIVDIVGIAFINGQIVIFNLRSTKKVLSLHSEHEITSLSFSTCLSLSKSLLATSTINGYITIWDLNTKSIHCTISNNFSSLSNIIFLPNEPLLLCSSGIDNAIKMFKFDNSTAMPSLLKQRTGHKNSPKKIRFYGESANYESNHILSIDEYTLRNISIINEHMSKEFSNKKMNDILFKNNNKVNRHIISFDFNEFRERDFANIAVVYSEYEAPVLYSYENSAIYEKQPQIKTKNSKCICVCISMCGNFGICGFENGAIEEFNMESGRSKWVIEKAHSAEVSDLKTDGINSMFISISYKEKTIKFWEMLQHSLIQSVVIEYYPHQIELNRDNELVCLSLENNAIQIYDKSQIKIVRSFNIVNSSYYDISDFIISKNAKWLLTSLNKSKCLKIFDILSSNLIEWVEFSNSPLSVAISPNNQYIAMSFENDKGIYLYINRTLFVDYEDIGNVNAPVKCELTTFKVKKIKTRKDFDYSKENFKEVKGEGNKTLNMSTVEIPKENKNLITLSNENRIKYRIINHIEVIQEKNKPQIQNKQKEKAPFFLFNINDVIEGKLPMKSGKYEKNLINGNSSPEFINLLKNYSHFKNKKAFEDKEFVKDNNSIILTKMLKAFKENKVISKEITLFLNSLNPYLLDLEIRSLDPLLNKDNNDYLSLFVQYIHNELFDSNENYEMIQAFLNRFIKVFSENIMENNVVKEKLKAINDINQKKFTKMDETYRNTMCLISYFGKIQI